jgi:hypothetical protein
MSVEKLWAVEGSTFVDNARIELDGDRSPDDLT